MSKFKELRAVLGRNKRWWLTPVIVVIFLLGVAVLITQSAAVTPFIYTMY